MAHVLVYHDDQVPANALAMFIEDGGHIVTVAYTVDDALMVLRSSLHPIVALVGPGRSIHNRARHQDIPFFTTVYHQPDLCRRHRYIALYDCLLDDDEDTACMQVLGASLLRIPFSVEEVLALVAQAVASFS